MIFIVGRNTIFSFLILIFLPLVFMAFLSGVIINQEIEKLAVNNLESDLISVKYVYNNYLRSLNSATIHFSNHFSCLSKNNFDKGLKKFKAENNVDIAALIDFSDIQKRIKLRNFLEEAKSKPVCSTEIISNRFLNDYDPYIIKTLNVNKENDAFLATLSQVCAAPIKGKNKIIVGIKFIKDNDDLWKDIKYVLNGRILFIQNNHILPEVIKDHTKEKKLLETDISSDIYKKIINLKNISVSEKIKGENYFSVIEPLKNFNKEPIGGILIAVSQKDFNKLKTRNRLLLILTISTVVILMSTSGYLISRKLLDSLNQIAVAASAVRNGDFSKKVDIKDKYEIGLLGENINRMIESLNDRETEVKIYQKEIHEQKENLQAIFDSLADGVIIISNECKIIDINPIVEVWTGLEKEEILGKGLTEILKCKCSFSCEDNTELMTEQCPLLTQNERLSPIDAKIINSLSKTQKLLSLTSSPISGISEQNFVIVLRDITEFKETYQLREDFMATLTHDLRVPIIAEANTLKLFLKGLFGYYTEKQKEALENMLDSNNDLLTLVNSLLDTYKYEAGRSELYKELVSIRKLAQDCIAELTPTARKNNQSINNNISKAISSIEIDKNEVKRVIRNIINNAMTYTPKDGVISIDAEESENEIIVKISDTGKGIPEDEIEKVFDRFYSKARKFRKIGTGLGLYLSKQIIEKHNGKIWVESKLGEGSTFFFTLPFKDKVN